MTKKVLMIVGIITLVVGILAIIPIQVFAASTLTSIIMMVAGAAVTFFSMKK